MSSVVEAFSREGGELFTAIVGACDAELLDRLRREEEPTKEERLAIIKILSDEFSVNLNADYEPTVRGKEIDVLLGDFLRRWPVETTLER